MTTIVLDTRTKEAKKMVEFLKATKYAKVVEDKIPNDETLQAMKEVVEGKVKSYASAKELLSSLIKKVRVYI